MIANASITLNTDDFRCEIDPDAGCWRLISSNGWLVAESAGVTFSWHDRNRRRHVNAIKNSSSSEQLAGAISSSMKSVGVCLHTEAGAGIHLQTEWMLSEEKPFCLLRLSVTNDSGQPMYLERVDYFSRPGRGDVASQRDATAGVFLQDGKRDHLRFFAQGWQSWSYAGVLCADDLFPRSRLGPLSGPMQLCWGREHPSKRGAFIADFYGALVDTAGSAGLVAGFITQKQAFGRVEADLLHLGGVTSVWQDLESVCLPGGSTFSSDWACLGLFDPHDEEPLRAYLELVAAAHGIGAMKDAVAGWCSWYCFGQDLAQGRLQAQLGWLAENHERVPLNLFQIDDGYQRQIGDWQLDERRFPESLEKVLGGAKGHDLQAGIWLAPLIAHPGSDLAKRHPDWLLRDHRGRAVNAGYGWGRFFHPLDGTHPAVKGAIGEWTKRLINEWGFDYLKLDFLYAGALAGARHDDRKTGAMVLHDVLSDIRETAGEEVFIVGCGCPIGSGLGIVDSMRISPDVSEHWRGRYKGISFLFGTDPGFPSAWNAIRNSFYRAHQHGIWWLNDPDCLVLRQAGSTLTENEVRTLATMVALSGGAVIDSDSLVDLAGDRVAVLARLIPVLNKRPLQPTFFHPDRPPILLHRFIETLGEWSLAAIFNLGDTEEQVAIDSRMIGCQPGDEIIAFNFWDHRIRLFQSETWDTGAVPAHGVGLWSFRKRSDRAQWIGDSIHISQGLCVESWDAHDSELHAVIRSGRSATERVWLAIPGDIRRASLDGKAITPAVGEHDIVSFEIQLSRRNVLEIGWD